MSDLPGEITKQILSAPPRIMRLTKYSLTAQGRSTPFSRREPTGSSSFEKASGWIRLPRPAAGMMPHILRLRGLPCPNRLARVVERRFEVENALCGGMFRQDTLLRRFGHPGQLGIREVDRGERLLRRLGDQDLAPRLEERIEPLPGVGQD